MHFVTHAHRQHSSVVTVIPKKVRQVLKIEPGDLIVFSITEGHNIGQIEKFRTGHKDHEQGQGHSIIVNKSRGEQAEIEP